MAILFGDQRPDGKIRVWRTVHTKREGKTTREVTKQDFPEGYEFDKIPEYPAPERGKDHIWIYNPETQTHEFETVERPLTTEERQEELTEKLDRLLTLLETREARETR